MQVRIVRFNGSPVILIFSADLSEVLHLPSGLYTYVLYIGGPWIEASGRLMLMSKLSEPVPLCRASEA